MLLITLFIISGCELISSNPEQPANTKYRSGKQGIEIDFASGSPPSKLYEGDELSVIAEIRNKGAFAEPYGKVVLYGFDSNILPFDGRKSVSGNEVNFVENALPKIPGKTPYIKEGGYDTIEFNVPENIIELRSGDKYEPTLVISACYHYMTYASETVCLLPDSSSLRRNNVCSPKTITLIDQGGPVAITKIEEEVISDKINFRIYMQDVGGGLLIAPGEAYGRCPFGLDDSDTNKINVDVSISGLDKPTCTPSNPVSLYKGKGSVLCVFDTKNKAGQKVVTSSYTTPMEIRLDYHYMDTAKKKIEVIGLN